MTTEHKTPFALPLIGDDEKIGVLSVLSSGQLVNGSATSAFENEFAQFLGVDHAVAVSNCTSGMTMVVQACDLLPGDLVVVPALTHVATAFAVEANRARIVFADVDPDTGCIDINSLKSMTQQLRMVWAVHFLGIPVDIGKIRDATPEGTIVCEDCALSLGSSHQNRETGSLSDAGVFSFYPSKHLCTMEGGMVTTNDPILANKIRQFRAFGYDKGPSQRSVPGEYDIVSLGGNFRMSEVSAAVGRVQLCKQQDWRMVRRNNALALIDALSEIPYVRTIPTREHLTATDSYVSPFCVNVVLKPESPVSKHSVMQYLMDAGIGVTQHYPKPVPNYAYFKKNYGFEGGEYPVAEYLAAQSISLPIGPHITMDNIQTMARVFKRHIKS